MQQETIENYALANARVSYPPLKHFQRRYNSESTLSTVGNFKDTNMVVADGNAEHVPAGVVALSLKRKGEESRNVEERQLERSTSKRRNISIGVGHVGHELDNTEQQIDQDERRDTASPSQPVDSNQAREGVEDAREGTDTVLFPFATTSAPVEIVDITDRKHHTSKKSSEYVSIYRSTGSGSHREVKRIGASELASAMALASLAYGKPKPFNDNNNKEPASIHRPKQPLSKTLSSSSSNTPISQRSAFSSPQQAHEYFLSRSMSTTSSSSYGYPRMMSDPNMPQFHPLYNHQRFNMSVPPEVFLANSKLSMPSSFTKHPGPQGPPVPPPQSHPRNKKWVCDFCNDASFDDFQEALRHERSCSCNPKAIKITTSRGSMTSAMSMSTIGEYERKTEYTNKMKKYQYRPDCDEGPIATRPDPDKTKREKNIYFEGSTPLALEETDSDWLSETNCYIRKECVEAFSASEADIMVSSKRGRISLYQVGIRCTFCGNDDKSKKASGAISFPVSVSGIYESVKRWKCVHLPECTCIPDHVKDKIKSLEKAACVPTTRQYWIDSAKAIGIDDTQDGLRFVKDPKKGKTQNLQPSNHESAVASSFQAVQILDLTSSKKKKEYLVFPEDKTTITPYVYCLMRQVQPCIFSEADRFLSRSKSKVGFAGFECRWCNGHAGLGRYFPTNPKALSTNSTSQNIYSHIQKCRKCPEDVKEELKTLKFEKPTWLRRTCGWRQAFFEKLWHRLHGVDGYDGLEYRVN